MGEGGSRRLTDEESVSFVSNTSSTASAVPLPPLGKAIKFTANFADTLLSSFLTSEDLSDTPNQNEKDYDRHRKEYGKYHIPDGHILAKCLVPIFVFC